MSPRTLADDPVPTFDDEPAPAPGTDGEPARQQQPRLTVREMQIALEAARSLAFAGPQGGPPPDRGEPAQEREEGSGADRRRATPSQHSAPGDVLDSAAAAAYDETSPQDPTATATATPPTSVLAGSPPDPNDPWVPEHDGPVSLTGVAAPRTRTNRRTLARPDKPARRPARARSSRRSGQPATLDADLAARIAQTRPVIVLVGACGGAGTTTAAVLLTASLAPIRQALLVGAGIRRAQLSIRAGIDLNDSSAHRHVRLGDQAGPITEHTPGVSVADCGRAPFLITTVDDDLATGPARAAQLASCAHAHGQPAVVVDWPSLHLLPPLSEAATHVVLVAPAASAGLLAAEYAADQLLPAVSGRTALSLLTVDVRGRRPDRTGRAALARLRALHIPTATFPFDTDLANNPAAFWPALRPRTRTAVLGALRQLLTREDTP